MRCSLMIAAAALGLAACAPAAAPPPSQLDGAWEVQQIAGADLNAQARIHFTIAGDEISGSTGCNSFAGAVTQFENTVTISNVAATERACLEEAGNVNEQRFLGVLPAVTRFARNGARLELLSNSEELLLARAGEGAE
ncbi:MAG TPA: META domain-containing protein [Terricaulis sp.]|nr:META domain-containing protein [Terricaulis sp.]